jgi:hypothetical protein
LVKDNLFILRPEWFGVYGLDSGKNFLQSPVCPCGCGEKAVMLLEDFEEMTNFAFNMLMENDCCHCAIFMHSISGIMYAFAKMLDENDEISVSYTYSDSSDFKFFKTVDDELEFHCYGLLVETQHGQWKIVDG